jgi:hypothetical protein
MKHNAHIEWCTKHKKFTKYLAPTKIVSKDGIRLDQSEFMRLCTHQIIWSVKGQVGNPRSSIELKLRMAPRGLLKILRK